MAGLARFSVVALALLGATATDEQSELTKEIDRRNNESLLWGPYKPNLYFGVRPRLPEGLFTGLMWGKIDNFQEIQSGECQLSLIPTPCL